MKQWPQQRWRRRVGVVPGLREDDIRSGNEVSRPVLGLVHEQLRTLLVQGPSVDRRGVAAVDPHGPLLRSADAPEGVCVACLGGRLDMLALFGRLTHRLDERSRGVPRD